MMKRSLLLLTLSVLMLPVFAYDFAVGQLQYTLWSNNGTDYATVTGVSSKTISSITIPATVTNPNNNRTHTVIAIRGNAFNGCSSLKTATMSSVRCISQSAFSGSALQTLNWGGEVQSLWAYNENGKMLSRLVIGTPRLGLESIISSPLNAPQKVLENGNIYLLKDGKIYNLLGGVVR